MGLRVLAGIALLFAATGAAQAASFDCNKAATPFEIAICTHPDLSQADELLSVAYQTAIGGLSKPALAEVQAAQRVWLDYAQKTCTDDAELPKGKLTDEQAACVQSNFTVRIQRLEQSRMWGGLRLFSVESYEVIPDTSAEPEAWSKVATREVSLPRIDGDSAEALAFADFVAEHGPKLDAVQDEMSDVEATAVVDAVNSQRISLTITNWWFGHGAAHGNYDISHAHFLRQQQRALEATDIFDKDGWQEALGALALDELDRTIDGGIWAESRDEAGKTAGDVNRWNFSNEGLVIQYQPYEVTAYAYGAPTITIPWAQLTDYLSADALTIAQS